MVELIILAIVFFSLGGLFLNKGFAYLLVGVAVGAVFYVFVGVVFLFLSGLIIYASFEGKEKNKLKKRNEK